MIPFCKSTVTGVRPSIATRSGSCSVLFFAIISATSTPLSAAETDSSLVGWGTESSSHAEVAANPLLLYGLNLAGDTSAVMAKTVYNGADPAVITTAGDFVELGYFASDAAGTPSATSGDLFLGNYWIPLTSKTTVGMRGNHSGAGEADWQNVDGVIWSSTLYDNESATYLNKATTFEDADGAGGNPDYSVVDSISGLEAKLDKLDAAAAGGAYLAIRFYDVDPESATGGFQSTLNSNTKKSRYNTITSSLWTWTDRATGTDGSETASNTSAYFHNPVTSSTNNIDTNLEYEMTNESYGTVEIGTGGSNTLANLHGGGNTDGSSLAVAKRTATIAYRDGTPLNLANIGDTIVSDLNDAIAITGDASTARDLTVLARSVGTTYTYTGDISTSKTEIHKVGAGTQVFAGAIDTSEALWIDEGTLTLTPANAKTQVFEYITDDGSGGALALDNDNFAAHVVELGFVTTTTAKTFSGAVALSDSGANAIKVASGAGDADYAKEQVFSGVVSGAATLEKKGVGRLNLTGSNTLTGNINIDDGVLVVGHNNALGQGGEATTVTINKGKLEVASGITTSSDVTIQGGASRNFIGGDGTVNTVVIGSDTNEVDVISPGQGFASSFNRANQQVPRGNGDVDASVGSFTATNLSLVNGGVYDWEMKDFDGTTPGTDWDLLNFSTLILEPGETFNVNIYGVKTDGTAGMPAFSGASADNLLYKTGRFRFLSGSAGNIDWNGAGTGGNGSAWDAATINSYFAVNDDNFAYYNYYWGGDWTVEYSGGNFNLAFSAVPEPSTYVMVTGLLMLPGFQFLRRFRKRKNKSEE